MEQKSSWGAANRLPAARRLAEIILLEKVPF
jgi:hypothetical protein